MATPSAGSNSISGEWTLPATCSSGTDCLTWQDFVFPFTRGRCDECGSILLFTLAPSTSGLLALLRLECSKWLRGKFVTLLVDSRDEKNWFKNQSWLIFNHETYDGTATPSAGSSGRSGEQTLQAGRCSGTEIESTLHLKQCKWGGSWSNNNAVEGTSITFRASSYHRIFARGRENLMGRTTQQERPTRTIVRATMSTVLKRATTYQTVCVKE